MCPHCNYNMNKTEFYEYGEIIKNDSDNVVRFVELKTYLNVKCKSDPLCLLILRCIYGNNCNPAYLDLYEKEKHEYLKEYFGEKGYLNVLSDKMYLFMSDVFYKNHLSELPLDPNITEIINHSNDEKYKKVLGYCISHITNDPNKTKMLEIEACLNNADDPLFRPLLGTVDAVVLRYTNKPAHVEDLSTGYETILCAQEIQSLERMMHNSRAFGMGKFVGDGTLEYVNFESFLIANLNTVPAKEVIVLLKNLQICGFLMICLRDLIDSMPLAEVSDPIVIENTRKQLISLISALKWHDAYRAILSYYGVLYDSNPDPFEELNKIATREHSHQLFYVSLQMLLETDFESRCKIKNYWQTVEKTILKCILYGINNLYTLLNDNLNRKKRDKIAGAHELLSFVSSFGIAGGLVGSGIVGDIADKVAESSEYYVLNEMFQKAAEDTRAHRNILKKYKKYPEALFLLGISYRGDNDNKMKKLIKKALKRLDDANYLCKAYKIYLD